MRRGVLHYLERIAAALDVLAGIEHPAPSSSLNVTAVRGRTPAMPIKAVAPLSISDVQSVQLSLKSVLPDGSPDPGPFSWSSSDPSLGAIVGDKVDADGNHVPDPDNTAPAGSAAWVLTPGGPGVVVVVASSASPNVDANSIEITLTEGRSGSVNLSAGTPISDL